MDDAITQALALIRNRQFAQANDRLNEARAECEPDRVPVLYGCKGLVDWYLRPQPARYEDRLPGAIAGVAVLRDAGYRPHIAWDMARVGYAMGVLGNLELGLAWLDLAIEDAKQLNDERGQVFFISHKGSLLAYADERDEANAAFTEALALCKGPQAPLRAGVLSSLSHLNLLRAGADGTNEAQRREFATKAMEQSREALKLMEGSAEFARTECSALNTSAHAHYLLGELAQAETAFKQGLEKASLNRESEFQLLVGYAELMIDQGRAAEATEKLDIAEQRASAHQVNDTADRLIRARIKLAERTGDTKAVQRLWEQRFKLTQQRYKDRLKRVHEHAEALSQLMRLQTEARNTRMQLQTAKLEALEARLESAEASRRERETVMQNLHDGLGSQLVTARLRAQGSTLSQPQLVSLLEECIADLHLVVDVMNNQDGDLGRALRYLRNRTHSRLTDTAVRVSWALSVDDAPPMPPTVVTNLLRIIQEALTNSLKHAQANNIQITCTYEIQRKLLRIEVQDDGIGLISEPSSTMDVGARAVVEANGQGIQNLRRRAQRLGAELEVRSAEPGSIIMLSLELPFSTPAQ